jgi:hypothetical protein
MNRSSILALGFLLSSTLCFGQTTPSESQTLQALLLEVRQLRQDLQTTTVAAQRAQILLYRLQGQEAAVARACPYRIFCAAHGDVIPLTRQAQAIRGPARVW